jgi:hypothetical protein
LLSLFLAGILAGEEVVVRYGVHPSLAALDERSQIQARQALIRSLRVLVPTIFVGTAVSAVAVLALDGADDASAFGAPASWPYSPGSWSPPSARCRSTRAHSSGRPTHRRRTGGR